MTPLKVLGYLLLLGCLVLIVFLFLIKPLHTSPKLGITWSKTYADYLGLQSPEALNAVFTELPSIEHVRIPVYWNIIEPSQGDKQYQWLDELISVAKKHNKTITLAIGSRVPRWPECWKPDWVLKLPIEQQQALQLEYIQALYERYHTLDELIAWQVENEVTLTSFQSCPGIDKTFVKKELALLRMLMAKNPASLQQITTTESGELSSWQTFKPDVDAIGISLYHKVRMGNGRVWSYSWLPKSFYYQKARLLGVPTSKLYISEYQLEPWTSSDIRTLTQKEIDETLTIEEFRQRLDLLSTLGIDHVDLWGAEWWYWMKLKGTDSYWNRLKDHRR